MKKYLEAGKIINTHGIKGDVKIEPWTDSPSILAKLKTLFYRVKSAGIKNAKNPDGANAAKVPDEARDELAFRPYRVVRASVFKSFVICHFDGIETFEEANLLRGKVVFADRNDIPLKKGAFFIADLIGLPLIDADSNVRYGVIKDVINRGANDIYEIDTGKKDTVYFPAVKEFIDRTEIENAVFVRPPKGIFDDDFVLDENSGTDENTNENPDGKENADEI